jgi:hypothetical protein
MRERRSASVTSARGQHVLANGRRSRPQQALSDGSDTVVMPFVSFGHLPRWLLLAPTVIALPEAGMS